MFVIFRGGTVTPLDDGEWFVFAAMQGMYHFKILQSNLR